MRLWFVQDVHRQVRAELSEYLDQRLDKSRRARLEAHLGRCAACRAELETLGETVAHLRAMPQLPAPRSFRITADQVQQPAREPLWYGLLPGLRLASATVVLLFVIVIAADTLLTPRVASVFTGVAASVPSAREAPAAMPSGVEDTTKKATLEARPSGAEGAPPATPELRRPSGQQNVAPPQLPGQPAPTGQVPPTSPKAERSGLRVLEGLLLTLGIVLVGATVAITFIKSQRAG